MEKYEIHKFLEEYKQKLSDMYQALQIEEKEPKLKKLNDEIASPEFWNDQKRAQAIIVEANALRDTVLSYTTANTQYKDISDMVDLALEDTDAMMMLEESIQEFKKYMASLEEKALFTGKYDFNNCILELHPGAGGTESMDWADMLYRMYTRFCARKGFKCNVIDFQAGDEAGIKSVTLSIEGPYAYGLLKAERGVHR
jgi:peptide chain release factor 2